MTAGRQIVGYRVLAKIGEGAASVLYAVQHPKTKQVWALKRVIKKSEKDQRFLDQVSAEYAVGSKLDHRSIRAVKKLIKHRKRFKVDSICLLMELVDAQTLEHSIPRTYVQAVRIFTQVAKGLGHMHGRGFVHADIKPSNILITDEGGVKIIDLGQACPTGTVKKRIQGTPGYMAPEQAHRQTITAKTDIYNLGAMMYWVLAREVIPTAMPPKNEKGNSLFSGALDADQLKLPVPLHVKNPRIHPLLSKQILDCVQVHPDDRPESMEVVASRLELIGDILETPSSDVSRLSPPSEGSPQQN